LTYLSFIKKIGGSTILDMQFQELNNCFNETNSRLLICMACLSPTNLFSYFDKTKLVEVAKFYPRKFCHTSLPVRDINLRLTSLTCSGPHSWFGKFYKTTGSLCAFNFQEGPTFMMLLTHCLIGKFKDWYLDKTVAVMTKLNTLEDKFINSLYPQSKVQDPKIAIVVSSQSLSESWERYNL